MNECDHIVAFNSFTSGIIKKSLKDDLIKNYGDQVGFSYNCKYCSECGEKLKEPE